MPSVEFFTFSGYTFVIDCVLYTQVRQYLFARTQHLKDRTKRFAVDVIKFCNRLENKAAPPVINNQLLRSSTSVAANYRAACRSQSRATFIAKLAIVEEEADESLFWFEVLEELNCKHKELTHLKDEANQLAAIIVASRKTAKQNR